MENSKKKNINSLADDIRDSSKSLKTFFSSWIIKNKIRKSNPSISHFNFQSTFIYEPRYYKYWYDQYQNKNNYKPKKEDISYLEKCINLLNDEHKCQQNKFQEIEVLDEFKDIISSLNLIKPRYDVKVIRVKEIITNSNKSMNISTRRIQSEYIKKYKEYISHNTIYKILKNILGYRFLKCSVKTQKLKSIESVKQTYFYIKIFLRALRMGFNFIFIDESSIYTQNNNYKTWKLPEEEIYTEMNDSYKRNLLLAVNKEKTIYFKITEKTTTSIEFQKFFFQMLSCLNDEEISKTIFIMDNHSSHLTPQMFELYHEKKLKVLFGVPYFSQLNMIELVFRGLKNITYKLLFKTIKDVEKKVKETLNDKNFCDSYKYFFKETLNYYLCFLINNNNIILDN